MANTNNTARAFLPRPSEQPGELKAPISGSSESAFTTTFGTLLPPAQYLQTPVGKAAFYPLVPSGPTSSPSSSPPSRVLLLHGVQTPALGLLPLTTVLQASHPHIHFVLLDLWGHGLSDTPALPHTPALFHELIDALLAQLSWPSAHFLGYSFGGATTAGYVATRPERVESFVLVAPAGLMRLKDFTAEEQAYLLGDTGDEAQAHDWIINWLEDGGDVVPEDWKEQVGRGEVVPAAVRQWQKREHRGHVASIVSMFRDGGALDEQKVFAEAAGKGMRSLVVLGEMDDVCSVGDLEEVGFKDVHVVKGAGHGVVRERVPEVAALISDFWDGPNTRTEV
ncbi:hypothetical protein B0A48_07140 [Cryoendolithus antarcticus]|uniref:AB hydrolase-1 domain-containing protein n=1 Tax=Cryoendolithus antarcticus TaxID=1507870 RepID=A0A1V8T7Q9_9PEZI|nr:hypothetical protein B0A48_07140 [Cryoendolithus antarcticus]